MQRLGIKRCALFFIIPHRWLSLWSWSWTGPQLTAIGAQHLAWIAAAICEQTFFVLLAEMPYIQIRFGNPAPTRLEMFDRSFVPGTEDRPDHQLMRFTPRFCMGLAPSPSVRTAAETDLRRRP